MDLDAISLFQLLVSSHIYIHSSSFILLKEEYLLSHVYCQTLKFSFLRHSFYDCFTDAILLLYTCFTHALQMFYGHFPYVLRLSQPQ